MNELEQLIFESHVENLINANFRVKELEKPIKDFLMEIKSGLIDSTLTMLKFEDIFNDLMEK